MRIAPPVFVTGCARSGTTLFTRLLDGHPGVLVFPIELKYFRYLDVPTFFPNMKLASCSTPRAAVAAAVDSPFMAPLYGADDSVRRRKRVLEVVSEKVDAHRFRESLHALDGITDHRTAFLHFFCALLDGLGRKAGELEHVSIVEKTPFQEQNVEALLDAFPDARFIQMVRNPYAVAVSWRNRSGSQRVKPELPGLQLESLARARSNARKYPANYRVISYEDLAADTRRVMTDAAAFLGLPFDPVLLEPMILGERWGGNSSITEKNFSGVSPEMIDAWRDEILPIEVHGVNQVLSDHLAHFGYERMADPKLWQLWRGARSQSVRLLLSCMRAIRNAVPRESAVS